MAMFFCAFFSFSMPCPLSTLLAMIRHKVFQHNSMSISKHIEKSTCRILEYDFIDRYYHLAEGEITICHQAKGVARAFRVIS